MRHTKLIAPGLLALLLFNACSVKKYIPDDEFLYRGGKIKIENEGDTKDIAGIQYELENVRYPDPNSRILGIYSGLYFHYKNEKEHPGVINRFLNKKLGEEPAYLSDVNLENTMDLLQNRLENNGIFYGEIDNEVKIDSSGKTAKIDYLVKIKRPYRLKTYQYESDSTDTLAIHKLIKESLAETELTLEKRFVLADLKLERERIDDYLKAKGYYYFNKDFLLFEVDTNRYDDRKFDLYLSLKDGVPEKSKVPYVLDSVEVYASIYNDTVYGKQDTIRIEQVDIIQGRRTFFKPERLRPFVLLEPGQRYHPEMSKFTSRRLSSIGTYKYVNIRYEDQDTVTNSSGVRHLKNVIELSPLPKRSIQFEMQGVTKSNGFTGPGLKATYVNRNIFKGGENLNVQPNLAYERQFGKNSGGGATSLQLGLKASLILPRMLFPGNFEKAFYYAIPKTKISAGMDFLHRSKFYSLNSFSTSFGYIWEQNRFVTHTFNPLSIDYVNLTHTSEQFQDILDKNPFLRRSFEQQFIAGFNYSFIYNELSDRTKRGRIFFQANLDVAGNTISLFAKRIDEDHKEFLGLKYAQYAKADIDFSYHYGLGRSKTSSLVGHLFLGYGLPYGNSASLPFVKQYFAGGPYSVRAFRIRGLGPGTYVPENKQDSYFDHSGDIRFESNLEYRFPIYSFLKGAVFADAGNVWLHNTNESLPGGKFSKDFYKELGVGTGFGLRVDVQGFVIRLDLSSALKRPTEKWRFEYDRPLFNFGIGYPF